MYLRKKIRTRLFWITVIVLAIIFWRGLTATTKDDFDCEFRLVYAVCTSQTGAEMPSLWQILKAGVSF